MGQLFVAVGPPEDDDIEYVEANAREVSAWLHSATSEQRREVAFALSVRSDTASRDLSMDLEGYSKDGVGVWLHAHPAEAVEIVRALKVATAWGQWNSRYAPNPEIPNGDYDYSGEQTVALAVRHGPYSGGIPAKYGYCLLDENVVYVGDSIEEAKSAADAALRAAGWSLA